MGTGSVNNNGGVQRFFVRTGEVPTFEASELGAGEHFRTGSAKVGLGDVKRDETWYDHHNVPEIYRGLCVGEDGQRMPVTDESTELVLNALDPDENLRTVGGIAPELVAWLAIPVEREKRPRWGFFKRAAVGMVEVDTLAALHAPLGTAMRRMQGAKKPPKTEIYLQILASSFRSNGAPPVDKDDSRASGRPGNGNPFRRGMTTLEFQKKYGGRRMYGTVNSLWKPGQVIEADDRSGLWEGICRFAAEGLANMRTVLLPAWEASMMTYQPTALSGIR